jgi:hypothetical protein
MTPVIREGRKISRLITLEISANNGLTTGKLVAGGSESLDCVELNPDGPISHEQSNNTCNILASQVAILPARSQVIIVGSIVGNGQSGEMPEMMLIEPIQISNPGVYVARAVSNVFLKDGMSFLAVQGAPQDREGMTRCRINPMLIQGSGSPYVAAL